MFRSRLSCSLSFPRFYLHGRNFTGPLSRRHAAKGETAPISGTEDSAGCLTLVFLILPKIAVFIVGRQWRCVDVSGSRGERRERVTGSWSEQLAARPGRTLLLIPRGQPMPSAVGPRARPARFLDFVIYFQFFFFKKRIFLHKKKVFGKQKSKKIKAITHNLSNVMIWVCLLCTAVFPQLF